MEMTPAQQCGQRLKRWMELTGYGDRGGQERFSAESGISQPQLSRYVAGKAFPLLDVLIRLATIMKVNVHWLVTGDGTMYAPQQGAETRGVIGTIVLHDQGETYGLVRMPAADKGEDDAPET